MTEKLAAAPKVLIVSNQQTTGPLWVFSLQQQKLQVVLEPDPSNTIQRWEKEIPDLIILDINLPESSTLELIRFLRAETIIPIILLTPARAEDYMLETYRAGVDDCIIKPVSPSLFQAKIKVWLKRSGGISTDTLNPLKVGTLQLFPSEKMVLLEHGGAIRLTNVGNASHPFMKRPVHQSSLFGFKFPQSRERHFRQFSPRDQTIPAPVCLKEDRKPRCLTGWEASKHSRGLAPGRRG
jgi:CheY-like chemotaxis protein